MNTNYIKKIKNTNRSNEIPIKDLHTILLTENLINIVSPNIKTLSFFQNPDDLIKSLVSNNDFLETAKSKRASLPLGKYAEYLFGIALELNPNVQLLAKNIQIFKNNKTIGEIDFLAKESKSNLYYHIEFAQKYYLKTKYDGKNLFLGPSKKDWYKNKLDKLMSHQLELTKKHNNIIPLEYKNFDFIKSPIVKGSFFYPLEEYDSSKASHSYGWWTDIENFINQPIERNALFQLIYFRKDWIDPFYKSEIFMNGGELIKEFTTNELISNGLMVCRYTEKKEPLDRGFIMEKGWPNNS